MMSRYVLPRPRPWRRPADLRSLPDAVLTSPGPHSSCPNTSFRPTDDHLDCDLLLGTQHPDNRQGSFSSLIVKSAPRDTIPGDGARARRSHSFVQYGCHRSSRNRLSSAFVQHEGMRPPTLFTKENDRHGGCTRESGCRCAGLHGCERMFVRIAADIPGRPGKFVDRQTSSAASTVATTTTLPVSGCRSAPRRRPTQRAIHRAATATAGTPIRRDWGSTSTTSRNRPPMPTR